MSESAIDFTFSDTIAGYVTEFDESNDSFGIRTTDGREFRAFLTPNTFASGMRNFGEAYLDLTGQMHNLLTPDRYVFLYGVFYAEAGAHRYEVKSMIFPTVRGTEYAFERPSWWQDQSHAVADFYLRAQFPDGEYDWREYRTNVALNGTKVPDYIRPDVRQETDTISRLIYGFASAFMLTGDDRFLDAAETGTKYLHDHMRATDESEGVVYWYHAIDIAGSSERKVFASEFGDDYDAIPMYEQIYALAGPTQVFRCTGDPQILDDIDKTVALFERFYRDYELGGYFSHIDPVTLDPRADTLGRNRARKNWNSVGDHAPAFLINAVLATGREDLAEFLVRTADTIVEHFPDYENSPFVQERFFEDWTHDYEWGWQHNSAVVGHNLKIAWNLMRINSLTKKPEYVELARKIAELMPAVGSDQQRGGWYDVVERKVEPGQERHRFVWHDRKAWWQQEQSILAYLILAGTEGDPEYLRHAREAAAFYNAFFLDLDEGGVYFNVLANGIPYLVGGERHKGSHSMSGYHSIELCYLAAVYTNLLLTHHPLDLWFRPKVGGFPDGILRVVPDILPPGSVRITDVWIDEQPYTNFDAEKLEVRLPSFTEPIKVRVRVAPKADVFDVRSSMEGSTARLELTGVLSDDQVHVLRRELENAIQNGPQRIVLHVGGLQSMSYDALRQLKMFRQRREVHDRADFYIVGANTQVKTVFASAHSSGESSDFVQVDNESDVPQA